MKLFIDTSNNRKTVVSIDNLKLVEKYKHPREQKLLGLIDRALKNKKAKITDIDKIEVATGPGSFTGLRVAASVANTLAWVLNIKVNGKDRIFPKYT